MDTQLKIQKVADDEFFVEVPKDKDPTTVMADTTDLLRAAGEEVLVAGPQFGGFRVKMIMREGTFSAIQGAATQALEGLTISPG